MSFVPNQFDDISIATIRALAADVVAKANSGHPGMFSSLSRPSRCNRRPRRSDGHGSRSPRPFLSVGIAIWFNNIARHANRFVNANPKDSKWYNRDRFVLSNGSVILFFAFNHIPTVYRQTCVRIRYSAVNSLPIFLSCALQYVLLHLMGYKLTMDDLKAFRQIDSKTPGHPEFGHTDGLF